MSGVRLRLAHPDDGAAFAAIYGPVVAETAISFETEPPSAQEMAERVRATVGPYPWLAAEVDGAVVGYAYASQHRPRPAYRWDVDVAIYVAAEYRGRRIGTRLYAALLTILAHQGYCRAYAGIALPNAGSVAVHEAAGFTLVGVYHQTGFKRGGWHDVGWWERTLRDDDVPADPIRLAALPAAALAAALEA
ncbi:MAG: arsinothricin resistance N-acetyltransferase ArsN1 family B [Vulcanimicrobiaceae bacterium]|jgi:phosphinothricin acetyltransferase